MPYADVWSSSWTPVEFWTHDGGHISLGRLAHPHDVEMLEAAMWASPCPRRTETQMSSTAELLDLVERLPAPAELIASATLGPRERRIHAHDVEVSTDWWARELAARGMEDELFDAPDSVLTRGDLFTLGTRASQDPGSARRLLWAALAWGTGTRHRNNRARLTAVSQDPDRLGSALAEAAALARTDAGAAYRAMMPDGRNLVSHLGPPFFTKFLYFAGGGAAEHPCGILDSVVAGALAKLDRPSSWTPPGIRYWWPSSTYVTYTQLLRKWAHEASLARHEPVAADQIERWLFTPPEHR